MVSESPKKFDVVLVNLSPIKGAEKRGIRPCVVLQNNLANKSLLQTITIAPITKHIRTFVSMCKLVASRDNGLTMESYVDLSQIRTVDRSRMKIKLGCLESKYHTEINRKISDFLDLRDEFV